MTVKKKPAVEPKVKAPKRQRVGMCVHRLPDTAYCRQCDG